MQVSLSIQVVRDHSLVILAEPCRHRTQVTHREGRRESSRGGCGNTDGGFILGLAGFAVMAWGEKVWRGVEGA